MPERDYKTRRGELLAGMAWGKIGPSKYQVEGRYIVGRNDTGVWYVIMPRRPGSGEPDPLASAGARHFGSFTEALEYIRERQDDRFFYKKDLRSYETDAYST